MAVAADNAVVDGAHAATLPGKRPLDAGREQLVDIAPAETEEDRRRGTAADSAATPGDSRHRAETSGTAVDPAATPRDSRRPRRSRLRPVPRRGRPGRRAAMTRDAQATTTPVLAASRRRRRRRRRRHPRHVSVSAAAGVPPTGDARPPPLSLRPSLPRQPPPLRAKYPETKLITL